MESAERIIINETILGGKTIIKGTLISVTKEDILATLNYALDLLKAEHIFFTWEGNGVNCSGIFVADENIPIFVVKQLRQKGCKIV